MGHGVPGASRGTPPSSLALTADGRRGTPTLPRDPDALEGDPALLPRPYKLCGETGCRRDQRTPSPLVPRPRLGALPGLALPCLASPYLALPCLALPCLASPCLASPCLALPRLTLPCLALPCLASPCLALPCLASPCLA